MKNFLIGLLIGIGKIIPGVSGSVIAIRFNVYEKIIISMQGYFSNVKKNTIFLSQIFSGVLISILLLSNVMMYFYTHFRLITTILFALLILTGLKDILKKDNNYYISIIFFLLSIFLIKLPFKYNINFFTIGIIESISMIVPGVSGTAIFVSFGVYEKVLNLFINLNIYHLFYFGIGFIISSVVMINIMSYLFLHHKKETYSAILGFLISSVILMFI